jgi:16S rRNA (guanine(527)-N(7))-methyltransferase RsmG
MVTDGGKALTTQTIRQQLSTFGVEVSGIQVVCIQQYIRILMQWNEKLNLTAIRDPLEMLVRHFCESMYGAVAVPIKSGRLADIGSGAGFPGIPMKILYPEIQLFLVESNIKKGTFLAEVVRELGLKDTRVLISRYEELDEELTPLDVVCSRAVGDFGPFLGWAGSEKVSAGKVVLWIGGRDLEEVKKSEGWEWQEPLAVPQSLRRYLLVGLKKQPNVGLTTTK